MQKNSTQTGKTSHWIHAFLICELEGRDAIVPLCQLTDASGQRSTPSNFHGISNPGDKRKSLPHDEGN